jgi:hypothetical protein
MKQFNFLNIIFLTLYAYTSAAQVESMQLRDQTLQVELLFEEDFNDLSAWTIESSCTPYIESGILVWPCEGKEGMGTIWCNQRFDGPTLVTYEVVSLEGMQNINFFAYASHPEGLLETTGERTGHYSEYHNFQNYIVTFLTNEEPRWRVRFRKDPGFSLLSETYVAMDTATAQPHQMTYLFDNTGDFTLYVNGQKILTAKDPSAAYRTGYHGLRTWRSKLKYCNFKVYSIH